MGIDFGITEAIAVAGLVASAAGTGVSMIAQQQSAAATRNASNYQAQVALNQAQIAKQQAQSTAAAGEAATVQQQLKTRAQVGGLLAAQGASGVDVGSGSAVDVRSSAAELGGLDAMTVKSDYARAAYGYQTGATSAEAEAGLARQKADQAGTAGNLAAFGSLLSGASGVAKQYGAWQAQAGNTAPPKSSEFSYGYF